MPSIPLGSKVLVTGANGYVAAWVCKTLLEKGYTVKGTVRSKEKGEHLVNLFHQYGDKFQLAIVPDITKEDAFDDVVDSTIDAIEHTASPFHLNADDPQELIEPAVKGTTGILKSAIKNGPNVKRIVVTSSSAAIVRVESNPLVLTEEDWNNQAIEVVEKEGKNAPQMAKYRASKTLAEKAAWKVYEENKGNVQWDLVCINPPFVFGPVVHDVPTADKLNTSVADFFNVLFKADRGGRSIESLSSPSSCYIDVRDVAQAHVLSLEKQDAGDNRIIVSAGPFTWQDVCNAAHSLSPSPVPLEKITRGNTDYDASKIKHPIIYDPSKGQKIWGFKYRTIQEITQDSVEDFKSKGWI